MAGVTTDDDSLCCGEDFSFVNEAAGGLELEFGELENFRNLPDVSILLERLRLCDRSPHFFRFFPNGGGPGGGPPNNIGSLFHQTTIIIIIKFKTQT